MPFDGVGLASDDRLGKIDKVIDLLATPDRWLQGALRDGNGRYCLRGAMMAVDALVSLRPVILRAIKDVTGKYFLQVETFNDHFDTRHDQVLRVLVLARDKIVADRLTAARDTARQQMSWRAKLRAIMDRCRLGARLR